MKAKVYRIEYRLSAFTQYSTDLEDARDELRKKGYKQTEVLSIADNKADCWEVGADQIFKKQSARIIEIPCINEVPDQIYRLKSAMGIVEMMTPAEIADSFCPDGNPLPGVEVDNDYLKERITYTMPDYIVIVSHDHVSVKLKTIHD